MTLLRLVRAAPESPAPTPRVLSMDAWAFRRGRVYGTILVDLDQHRAVELLPEATAPVVVDWLQEHRGIAVLRRDRGGVYAEAGRRGAPGAIQVADRFHRLLNLREVIERLLRRYADQLEHVPVPGAPGVPIGLLRPDRQVSRERTRREMHDRFMAIQQARATGLSISATARALGLHRHTIEKYDRRPAAPERRHTWRHPSALTPYEGYLQERRRQGARKALPLWRELRALGYTGAYQNVARFMAALRKLEATGRSGLPRARGLTARRTVAETRALRQVVALGPESGARVGLLEQFARLIRREGADPIDELASWKQAAVATGWEELGTFVARLEQDQAAVEAALRLPYSQGQTEGQINRLKMLKRAMFGRANFDLLRKRFLAAT